MTSRNALALPVLSRDLPAAFVVALVALPLCLGIALASGAPLFAGIVAGILGGLVVGALSGSHTSVSGPAAGLTAIVATQIEVLGSFEAFLAATFLAGVAQVGLGVVRAGFIAAFFPSSVVKGLLAAIGILLILKQIPHAVGHDLDPIGEMAFQQPDHENTFSELVGAAADIHTTAAIIGVASLVVLVGWSRVRWLEKSIVPAPLVVVTLGILLSSALGRMGEDWSLASNHLVQVPVVSGVGEAADLLRFPDFSSWAQSELYVAAVTIAIVASLETLLNLEAVDNLDPRQRRSPPSRELVAQGVGNMAAGLVGGLPVTSVVIRGSVNIAAGARTKYSAIFHGLLLLGCVLLVPHVLNTIPLASLAAILIVTGFKLASPRLLIEMWRGGREEFMPFIVTVGAIIVTDLLVGILAGLTIAAAFILHSNLRRPIERTLEKHMSGDVLRIQLGEQVSFLNRAALERTFDEIEPGSHVLLDAQRSDYIDPDVLDVIRDFEAKKAPARRIEVSLVGFKSTYSQVQDKLRFVDYSTRETQAALTPDDVLRLLREGNRRFRSGQRVARDFRRQINDTATAVAPLAVVLSCIDSRSPPELIFDLGLGDILSIRASGTIAEDRVIGSMEFGSVIAGAKLIVVLGHTECLAMASAVYLPELTSVEDQTECRHLHGLLTTLRELVDPETPAPPRVDQAAREEYLDALVMRNVQRTIHSVRARSATLDRLVRARQIAIVGGMYDVRTGHVAFHEAAGFLSPTELDAHDLAPSRTAAPRVNP